MAVPGVRGDANVRQRREFCDTDAEMGCIYAVNADVNAGEADFFACLVDSMHRRSSSGGAARHPPHFL
ncbi:hypothetical protein [Pseudoduganella lutea]|uniref:Uncharacterized protein n=1 Tax=Pseudoduganella lutea TaxID=321985 RepID=A0A4P6KZT5_9BURK|nr:hypothetical protein [Pseudoduganella lutea]QBE64335.1 hypothetical protein EWM63_16150 [Pseudoduganella lutea]